MSFDLLSQLFDKKIHKSCSFAYQYVNENSVSLENEMLFAF